ncbi:hypothetical protein VQ042_20390 [Aurantimonas sp. A2-1-M11]|uniref:hypothetical protein n=1 Tax=Aurantimonas sp. A2-1-M11 TaxID=3113712 RepID=UPI002F934C67
MSGTDFPLARRQLDAADAADFELAIWWRDDDARGASHDLARLLAQRQDAGVPLALAVIPDGARPDLRDALAADDDVCLFLHGWRHANHAPAGDKRAEFGDHRPLATMLDEARRGHAILAALAGDRFLPVFVPPWNRIGPGIATRLADAGLPGLSTFAVPARRHLVATHLDLMDWRAGRAQDWAALDRLLAAQIAARLPGGEGGAPGAGGAAESERDEAAESARSEAATNGPMNPPRESPLPNGTASPTVSAATGPALRPAGTSSVRSEPIGLLTHHLQHDVPAWDRLAALLDLLAPRAGIAWPRIPELFDLAPVGDAGSDPSDATP